MNKKIKIGEEILNTIFDELGGNDKIIFVSTPCFRFSRMENRILDNKSNADDEEVFYLHEITKLTSDILDRIKDSFAVVVHTSYRKHDVLRFKIIKK